MSVTVILNGYKRPYLKEQLEAINNQTVKVDETLLWYNNPGEGYEVDYEVMSQVPTALCNTNFGVWARFAFAFMAKSEYICIFDDDTVPGTKSLNDFAILLYLVPELTEEPLKFLVDIIKLLPNRMH